MSTILNALRKAKSSPPKDAVDARQEILSGTTHNYLAEVPEDAGKTVRNLKWVVAGSACIILMLGAVVLGLLERDPASATAADARDQAPANPSPIPTPAPPSEILKAEGPWNNVPVVSILNTPAPTAAPSAVAPPSPTPQPPPARVAEKPAAQEPSTVARRETIIDRINSQRLEGIVWDKKNPMAMMGGRLLRVGTEIESATVVRILPDAVIFDILGEEYALRN